MIQVTDETAFHPLAELKPEQLSEHFAQRLSEGSPSVLLKNDVYVGDYYRPNGATHGQLSKYSLIERSWDILATPEGAVRGYSLSVWSDKLVLLGAVSEDHKSLDKVWVHQEKEWRPDVIPPVPADLIIMSATSTKNFLFVMCKLKFAQHGTPQSITSHILYYHKHSWSMRYVGPIAGPYCKANIIADGNNLYVSVSDGGSSFYTAPITFNGNECEVGEFSVLSVMGKSYIPKESKLTIFRKKLIVAAPDSQTILYTPFTDMKGTLSLVDIDVLARQYESIFAVFGFERSLLVIGKERSDLPSGLTIVKFNSEGMNYNVHRIRDNMSGKFKL